MTVDLNLDASTDRQSGGRLNRAAFASSASDEWSTPRDFFAVVDREFGPFDLDPCCVAESAKADHFYTAADDGLAVGWFGRVFMNPPYSRIADWMSKAWVSARAGHASVVCLVPARTDTRWFWQFALSGGEVLLLPGRLKFGDGRNSAPFPSCLVLLRAGLPWWAAGRIAPWDWKSEGYKGLPWPG